MELQPADRGAPPSGYWLGLTAGRVAIGHVADRIGSQRLIVACLGGAIAGVMLVWSAPAGIVAACGLWLAGFSLGPIFPTTIAVINGLVSARLQQSAIGFAASLGAFEDQAAVSSERFEQRLERRREHGRQIGAPDERGAELVDRRQLLVVARGDRLDLSAFRQLDDDAGGDSRERHDEVFVLGSEAADRAIEKADGAGGRAPRRDGRCDRADDVLGSGERVLEEALRREE